MQARRPMPEPEKPTPTRPAPQLAEVRRLLDRYRPKDPPQPRRAGRPPVLNPPERKRGD